MSGLTWYGTSFDYITESLVTDVNTIIGDIRTSLTSTLPSADRWTESPSGTFKSPPDLRGRFMKVTLTRTSATRLAFQLSDFNSFQIVNGEIDVAVAGSPVNMYTGPYHLYIEANNGGAWEFARATLTDPRPEALDAHPFCTFGNSSRNSSGTLLSNANHPDYWCFLQEDSTIVTNVQWGTHPTHYNDDTANGHCQSESGADIACPLVLCTRSSSLNDYYPAGKAFQAVYVSRDNAPGVQMSIPIDVGVTGNFQVTQMQATGCAVLAVRRT